MPSPPLFTSCVKLREDQEVWRHGVLIGAGSFQRRTSSAPTSTQQPSSMVPPTSHLLKIPAWGWSGTVILDTIHPYLYWNLQIYWVGIAVHPDPHHPSVIKSDNSRSISIRRNMPFVRPLAATEMLKERRSISDEGTSDGVPEGD